MTSAPGWAVVPRAEALRRARLVLDAARRDRDSQPIAQAAAAAAAGTTRTAAEVEQLLRALRTQQAAAPAMAA